MAFRSPHCVPQGRLYLPDVRNLYSAQKTGQRDWGPFTDKEGETRGEVMSPSQGHGAAGWRSQASGSRLPPIPPTGAKLPVWAQTDPSPKAPTSYSRRGPGSTPANPFLSL